MKTGHVLEFTGAFADSSENGFQWTPVEKRSSTVIPLQLGIGFLEVQGLHTAREATWGASLGQNSWIAKLKSII